MKLAEIYERKIDRSINPAVVAQDRSIETINIEIDEYVFTDEIINNLYNTLFVIKEGKSSKTGIWINGYYGSGKSHFLKFLHYLVNKDTAESAFDKLVKAVEERDPFKNKNSALRVDLMQVKNLRRWYAEAEIEDILFNAQEVSKANKQDGTFTHIFFNMFNQCRGYNAYDIPLAILFEKYLDGKGALDDFKKSLKEETLFDWDKYAADLVSNELDTVMEVAKKTVPSLDTEALKAKLLNPNTYHIDTAKFSQEVKSYIETKGENYRLIFLVDEVSQFINDNKDVLLDLQTIVERISTDCNKQVWIACTAQQTIEEVVNGAGINDSSGENYGKIMGRFETRVSLESTDAAYITQRRILEKNSQGLIAVKELYKEKKEAILNQFVGFHELYKGFKTEEDFRLSYPFVPYQFKLISQVFDAFQSLEYVIKEVKDNERSILKITHETAKNTQDWELGRFISFDAFFNDMFWQNLIHKGQKALKPALELSFVQKDSFAQSVVKVLFMISNLGDKDKANFRPTIDNLTLLLMSNVDENKLHLRNEIEKVLEELINKNIIREEKQEYYFYNEDEAELSTIIQHSTIGLDFRAEMVKNILFPDLRIESKYRFLNNDFKLSVNVAGRQFLGSNAVDAEINFILYEKQNAAQIALESSDTKLSFCLYENFENESPLRVDFEWYCKVESFLMNNQGAITQAREKSLANFRARNRELFEEKVRPGFIDLFNKARVVAGNRVLENGDLRGNNRDRYQAALEKHFEGIYRYASLADKLPNIAEELRKLSAQTVNPEMYGPLNPMNDAEKMVNEYITRMGGSILLSDLIKHFAARPYGWKDVTTIYITIELNRRGLRQLKYKNQDRYPIKDFATKGLLTAERSSLEITEAQVISQELINQTIEAWKRIFNEPLNFNSDANALFDLLQSNLKEKKEIVKALKSKVPSYPFTPTLELLNEEFNTLLQIRDPQRLFQHLIAKADEMANRIDDARLLKEFIEERLSEYDKIKLFYEQNRANIENLEAEDRKKGKVLSEYFSSITPNDDFRIAKKTFDELKKSIAEKQKDLQGKATALYSQIVDNLANLAQDNGLDKSWYGDKAYIIEKIAKKRDLASLQLEISNASSYENECRERMLKEVFRRDTEQKRLEDEKNNPQKENKEPTENTVFEPPISFSLHKPNKVLQNEGDVNDYLNEIKTALMEMINENKKIIIK